MIVIYTLSHTNDVHYPKHENKCDMGKFDLAFLQFKKKERH